MNSSELSVRNFAIARTFAKAAGNIGCGVLLSGSNAWGAGYAVTPASDIDLLVIANDLNTLRHIVRRFAQQALISNREKRRFEVFHELFLRGKAEQFSLVAEYLHAAVSVDFLTYETAHRIASVAPFQARIVDGVSIRVIGELRTNPPRTSGYSLDDISTKRSVRYFPFFEAVKDRAGEVMGYLSETSVDGIDNQPSYYCGVMGFFLCIEPVLLVDHDGRVVKLVAEFRANILDRIGSRTPIHFTHEERMSAETREAISNSFKVT